MNRFYECSPESWRTNTDASNQFMDLIDKFCQRHLINSSVLLIGTGNEERQYFDWPETLIKYGARSVEYLEVFKGYCSKWKDKQYGITQGDVTNIKSIFSRNQFDVIFWCHGPEHVNKNVILRTFEDIYNVARKAVWFSMPCGNYYDEQGKLHGNVHETHLQKDLTERDFKQLIEYEVQTCGIKDKPDAQIIIYREKKIDVNMPEFVEFINLFCPNPKCIVEVGSLDANDSLFFKLNFPKAECFAIEGLPENYEKYMAKWKAIKCINAVVSDKNGMTKFYKKEINGLHGIHNRGNRYGTKVLELPCYTMDHICKEYKIPEIDVMKIDVEGATYEVLSGMSNLEDVKIMHVETESYPLFEGQVVHSEVEKLLRSVGFTIVQMSSVKITGDRKQHDSVWVKNGLVNQRCAYNNTWNENFLA